MFEIYLITALLCLASIVLGAAILRLLGAAGHGEISWLAGATGFAALVVISPFLIRLPGRATTAAIVLVLLLIAAGAVLWRGRGSGRAAPGTPAWVIGFVAALAVVALASLPFAFNSHVGILGEGILTNDHAAQLYWTDWLQRGFGPEPSAVKFGYPIGPQALTAALAEATGIDLIAAFNGLLLAIPALTALAALAALGEVPPLRRVALATLCGLPYLGAAFLAQSAFKETALALFVLAFAIAIAALSGRARDRETAPPRRAIAGIVLILAAASVFTFSLPGLAWIALALPLWLVLEALFGRSPVDLRAVADAISRHRALVVVAGLIAIAVAVVLIEPVSNFVDKIGEVQDSQGRLNSPIFPGEALGIWPEGDFRIVRGEVSGALIASAIGALALGFGTWVLIRRAQLALLATLVAGAVIYVGARLVAEIHVEAKALAVIAPLILLVSLRPLLAPGEPRFRALRYGAGVVLGLAALASTVLALRATPVGYEQRGEALERLAERAEGESLAFLGVDRFAGYWLRQTLARAPAGYVPEEIDNRPEKLWQQGDSVDFDTLDTGKLDKFRYAITTASAYNSAPPPNWTELAREGDYILWQRQGETPRSRILVEPNAPGAVLECAQGEGEKLSRRSGTAVVRPLPTLIEPGEWSGERAEQSAVGGQEGAFAAGATISAPVSLQPVGGRFELSLQYHSQVPLTVYYGDEPVAELPASLEGMYLDGAGRGAFWPVGEIVAEADAEVEVRAAQPNGLQDALGVPRRVWLGALAATPLEAAREVPIAEACGRYVDHFTLDKRGGASKAKKGGGGDG